MVSATEKRYRLFARLYAGNGMNGTQAAVGAGYSEKTAVVQASKLLRNPNVKRYVLEEIRKVLNETEMLTMEWLREVKRLAFSNITDVVHFGPKGIHVVDENDVDKDTKAAIQEISETITTAGGTIKVKMHSKTKALDLLGKYLDLYRELGGVSPDDEEDKKHDREWRRNRILELQRKMGKVNDAHGS